MARARNGERRHQRETETRRRRDERDALRYTLTGGRRPPRPRSRDAEASR